MNPKIPDGYRLVTLHGQEPPEEVLRHARLLAGEEGRYAKVVRYRYDAGKTIYEVLRFKAGRPPLREEILADLRADLERVEEGLRQLKEVGALGALLDQALFSAKSRKDLDQQRRELLETIETVEEHYPPGATIMVP